MDLFLVGPEKQNIMQEVTENTPHNILFNYVDGQRAADRYAKAIKPQKMFIDSGAFSAWTKGRNIDVDAYIDWINKRDEYVDLFGQVDVIPGTMRVGASDEQVLEAAKATWDNYLYMRSRVKSPEKLLYTFHIGESYQFLRDALEWKDETGQLIPYIALGGMVGKSMVLKRNFLRSCFKIIRESSNPKVKVHTFGMTSLDLLEEYPITSADSTAWIMTGANGNIVTDVGIIGMSDKMSNQVIHYSHLRKELQMEFELSLAKYGFSLEELRHSRDCRIMFNARYMKDKVKNLRYRPGPVKRQLF